MTKETLFKTSCVIALACFGTSGCMSRECTAEEQREAEATGGQTCDVVTFPEVHRGSWSVKTLDYTAGSRLVVRGDFQNLEIDGGASAGEVQVRSRPVVDLAEGRSDSQVKATLEELSVSTKSSDSAVTIESKRSGDSNVRAHFEIKLPAAFSGDIVIDQNRPGNAGGEVVLKFVGASRKVVVDLDALGTKFQLNDPSGLHWFEINAEGDISTGTFQSSNLQEVVINNKNSFRNTKTSFSEPPKRRARIYTDGGDLELGLPAGGDYSMVAASSSVEFSKSLPSGCQKDENEGGASLRCNDGPTSRATFDVQAGSGKVKITGFHTSN